MRLEVDPSLSPDSLLRQHANVLDVLMPGIRVAQRATLLRGSMTRTIAEIRVAIKRQVRTADAATREGCVMLGNAKHHTARGGTCYVEVWGSTPPSMTVV